MVKKKVGNILTTGKVVGFFYSTLNFKVIPQCIIPQRPSPYLN
jgi:hypothetical protein